MIRVFLYKPITHILLIIILGVLGYSNTFHAPFQFDDITNIVNNPIVKNLDYYKTPSKANIHQGHTEYPMLINRYIGSLTFALNYKIQKLDVTGYHAVNLLIHLINAMMIYWLVHLIFITLSSVSGEYNPSFNKYASAIALFSSLMFVTHPLQTQAVTYIVQRFTSLATMFYILSIIMYIKAGLMLDGINDKDQKNRSKAKGIIYYLTSLAASVLAMKTKEIAFTLPAMIVLYEFLFFKRAMKSRIVYLTPLLLTMLIIPATIIGMDKHAGNLVGELSMAARMQTDIPRLDYLFTQFRVIITYIRLIFFPAYQNLDYNYPIYHSIFDPEVFLSLMSLLIILCTVVFSFYRFRKTNPAIRVTFFGTAWFFAALSIESSFIPIADVIFEHRMYLPSFGVFLVISTLLVTAIERHWQKRAEATILLSIVITALILTSITFSRNRVWNDRVVLWQDVVSKSPEKARGYNYLGLAYFEKGDLDRAIKYYEICISLDSSFANAYSNLGMAYYEKGLIDQSIENFKKAIRINPSHANAHFNLGIAYGEKGLINEAYSEMKAGTMLQKSK